MTTPGTWSACRPDPGDATGELVWQVMTAGIAECGIPTRSLSDNGSTYTARFHGGEADFERNLRALGVRTINSTPFHPRLTLQPQFVVGGAFVLVGACSGLTGSSPVDQCVTWFAILVRGQRIRLSSRRISLQVRAMRLLLLIEDPLFSSAVLDDREEREGDH